MSAGTVIVHVPGSALKAAREKGVFIIHAPSSVTAFYKDTPQRKRAKDGTDHCDNLLSNRNSVMWRQAL